MDRTPAVLRTGGGYPAVDPDTGEFEDPDPAESTIMIHVSRPSKTDEAMPGGVSVQVGDLIIHVEESLGIAVGHDLDFWDGTFRVVALLRRYDVLDAVLQHKRKSFLVRRAGESESYLG